MPVALVTGASRGVGKGTATALAARGYTVFATGRTIMNAVLPPAVIRIPCDHLDDEQTASVFQQIATHGQGLDLLVNSAWGGYEQMVEAGTFTWGVPFWQQPAHRWQSMIDAGLRAAFIASAHAAKLMIEQRNGFIVNISFWAAQKYVGNTIYGISKAATDKMTADMAHELRPHNVHVLSLYPGLVRTEAVMAAAAWLDLSNSESPEFIGHVIAALHADPLLPARSGQVMIAAQAAMALNVSDIEGTRPRPLTPADV